MSTDELPWCGSHVKFFGFFLRAPSGDIFSVSVWMKSASSLIQPYHPSEQGHTSMFCAPTPLLASSTHQCHCYSWRLCLLFPPDCKTCKYWVTVVVYRNKTRHTEVKWLRTPAHRFPEFYGKFYDLPIPLQVSKGLVLMASLRQRADWIALP